jgi:hypothetical protein
VVTNISSRGDRLGHHRVGYSMLFLISVPCIAVIKIKKFIIVCSFKQFG